MDLILLAVPFFFVLIAVELVADRVRGQRNPRYLTQQLGIT